MSSALRRPRPQVTLIDGRSGSGKTELASELAERTPGATLIRLDDIYPGWDGLDAASRHIHDHVLKPLAEGRRARWQRWDWSAAAPAEWHEVDPTHPVIIEGCGALSRANRALADVGIWVELDEATRRQRAMARDGDGYAPYWDRWAAQEAAFIAREHPRDLADRLVTTA
jgi:uridine kinase